MTYLELVQRLKREAGIAGNDSSTTVNQTAGTRRLCDWISQSFEEIQQDSDFDFMRKSVTFNTVANQQTYHVGSGLDIDVSDFGSWRNDSFRAYLQSAGIATQIILSHWHNYSDFRDYYLLGSRQLVTARSRDIAIAPDRSLILGFTPNDVYVVSGEYYQTPQVLTLDTDIPIMPSRYHMAIVYKAQMKYGIFESAQEQIQAGQTGYASIMNRLIADQTPEITIGRSLI